MHHLSMVVVMIFRDVSGIILDEGLAVLVVSPFVCLSVCLSVSESVRESISQSVSLSISQ
jgi:hypothetical protein